MHLELLIPGLLPSREELAEALGTARAPSLERLLGRGRASRGEDESLEDWLAHRFGLEAPLPIGALTTMPDSAEAGDGFWMRADPVHLRVGMTSMALMPAAALTVACGEAEAIAQTLNAHFAPELEFRAVRPEAWCVRMAPNAAVAKSPLELAGADVDANLPKGADGARFHALMNEAQMLLHAHPVNEAREARGEPPINSLWFWGGGTRPAEATTTFRSASSDDPALRGLARLAGCTLREPGHDAEGWLAKGPPEGRHLVHVASLHTRAALGDASAWLDELSRLERDWFLPLVDALSDGRIGMLSIHAPDAAESLSVEVTRGDLRRFWRRARPLAAYA